jgi:hypothetical protein
MGRGGGGSCACMANSKNPVQLHTQKATMRAIPERCVSRERGWARLPGKLLQKKVGEDDLPKLLDITESSDRCGKE